MHASLKQSLCNNCVRHSSMKQDLNMDLCNVFKSELHKPEQDFACLLSSLDSLYKILQQDLRTFAVFCLLQARCCAHMKQCKARGDPPQARSCTPFLCPRIVQLLVNKLSLPPNPSAQIGFGLRLFCISMNPPGLSAL